MGKKIRGSLAKILVQRGFSLIRTAWFPLEGTLLTSFVASHRSALQRAFVRRCFHVLALPIMADYTQWFAVADTDGDGKVSGAEAVQFFQRAGLPQQSLAQLWELADNHATGFLDRKQFDIAMQLITIAQVRRPCICNDPKALMRGRVASRLHSDVFCFYEGGDAFSLQIDYSLFLSCALTFPRRVGVSSTRYSTKRSAEVSRRFRRRSFRVCLADSSSHRSPLVGSAVRWRGVR
jgi:hypothetical protein